MRAHGRKWPLVKICSLTDCAGLDEAGRRVASGFAGYGYGELRQGKLSIAMSGAIH